MKKHKRLVDTLISLASERKNVDAFVLCELCSKIGYTIQTKAVPDLPQEVKAIAVKLKSRYLILYRPSTSVISIQISVLHELCHILLHHLQNIELGKSFYTDKQEAEAERLASVLLSKLIGREFGAWWEHILKEQISFSCSPSSIQRFMKLMQKGDWEATNHSLGSHIARIKQLFQRGDMHASPSDPDIYKPREFR